MPVSVAETHPSSGACNDIRDTTQKKIADKLKIGPSESLLGSYISKSH